VALEDDDDADADAYLRDQQPLINKMAKAKKEI
jgi:hypothetical protein